MLLWVAVAFADAREDLEGALLARSLGDRATAQATLIRLRRSLAAEDPLRGLALFWTATIDAETGHPDRAREVLRECIRNGPSRDDCSDLLGRLELEQSAMRPPETWSFSGAHGMVHLWTQSDQGSVRVEPVDGDPSLVWTSRHVPDSPGTLLFAVDPGSIPPRRLSFSLQARNHRAALLPLFVDDAGVVRRAPRPLVVEPGPARRVNIDLQSIQGLDPRHLERVVFRDLSGSAEDASGSTEVVLDDVSLR